MVRSMLHLGVLDYLIKPFTFERLQHALVRYRTRARALAHESVTQADLDAFYGSADRFLLPRGLSLGTLHAVRKAVRDLDDPVSANQVATQAYVARVTARRYLEYLVTLHQVECINEIDGRGGRARRTTGASRRADVGVTEAPTRSKADVDAAPSLQAMLSVGARVARGGELRDILNDIAREAGQIVRAHSASILLLRTQQLFWLGGSWGPEPRVPQRPRAAPTPHHRRSGWPRRRKAAPRRHRGRPQRSPARLAPDRRRRGLRSLVAIPLTVGGDLMGVVIAWRSVPDRWTPADIDLLTVFADHAGNAIRSAALIDRQQRQLGALSRIVRDLRELTHEHANRIHGLSGLVQLGETVEARRFIDELLERHDESHRTLLDKIEQPSLAGLLLAEMTIARQQGIELSIDGRSRLRGLPETVTDAEAVSIGGHLITQAIEAVAESPPRERAITFYAATRSATTVLRTRRRGGPTAPLSDAVLVDAVRESWGTVRVDEVRGVVTTTVEIPNDVDPWLPGRSSPRY